MRKWLIDQLRRGERWKHENRRRAFQACFLASSGQPTGEAEIVLGDLRRFCKVQDSSFVPGDPYATALNEGRREVWNRILAHLYLSDDTIAQIVEQTYPDTSVGSAFDDEE